MTSNPYTLTPADIADLRASVRWRGTVGSAVHTSQIVWLPTDRIFGLIANGRIMATSARVEVLGACLIAERAEAGFIRRIIDSTDPVDIAALNPDARAAERSRRLLEDKAAREFAEEERKRKAPTIQPNPDTITAASLFDD